MRVGVDEDLEVGEELEETVHGLRFPEKKITNVEALRYFGLKGRHSIYKRQLPGSGRTLLVIMGITDLENQLQFKLLKKAMVGGGLVDYNKFLIKPHPGLSPEGLRLVCEYESKFDFLVKNQLKLSR